MEEFEVELYKQENKGLGIKIAGLVQEDTGGGCDQSTLWPLGVPCLWFLFTILRASLPFRSVVLSTVQPQTRDYCFALNKERPL